MPVYKQPPRPRMRRDDPEEDSPPGLPVYDPTERLARIRDTSQIAGNTDSIDNTLRDIENDDYSSANSGTSQSDARAAKNRRIAEAEAIAARSNRTTTRRTPVSEQEVKAALGNYKDLYKRSQEGYKKSGKRGIFIGIGAGGGIVSIIAGLMFMLPFKLPAIMDGIIDHTGKRIERVVEKRVERMIFMYMLKGSISGASRGNIIVTGNPIGDLFANIRTSKFEERLLQKTGLSLEAADDGVYLRANGQRLKAQTINDLDGIFRDGKITTTRDLDLLVREEIPAWRIFKRAKFARWLVLKYDLKLETAKRKDGESREDYHRRINREHARTTTLNSMRNLQNFVDCANSGGGSCSQDTDPLDGAEDIQERATAAIDEVSDEVADAAVRGENSSVVKKLIEKITQSAVGKLIPLVGWVDLAARLQHFVAEQVNNDLLQKLHAKYVSDAATVLATLYASYAAQTKAGDFEMETVGMFSDRFNGMEIAAAYDVVNGGTGVGTKLSEMEKINDSLTAPGFAEVGKTMFNTVGWLGRIQMEIWYQTVSRFFDFASEKTVGWLIDHSDTLKEQMVRFAKFMANILEGVFKFMGMYIDPMAIGDRLYNYAHMGFTASFNTYGKDIGMRELDAAQTAQIDRQIALERQEDLKHTSLMDRLFALDAPSGSLASTLLQNLPVPSMNAPLGTLAMASTRMVTSMPGGIARMTAPRALAAAEVNLYNTKFYGGTDIDLAADTSPELANPQPKCPENDPHKFNHCRVDQAVLESVNCSFVKCEDLYGTATSTEDQTGTGGLPQGTSQELAAQLMKLVEQKRVFFEGGSLNGKGSPDDGAYQDVKNTAAGLKITSTCKKQVTLDPRVLQILIKLAEKYTYRINSLVSDHHCNAAYHPKGQAADLGVVNGKIINDSTAPENLPFYREFAKDVVTLLPKGSELGQKQCLGDIGVPADIKYNVDGCNHIHFGVPDP